MILTFDDGPHPDFTPAVLDVLAKHQAKALFFLVGEQVLRYPEIVDQIIAEGHEIGNHSLTHAEFAELDYSAIVSEIEKTDKILSDVRWLKGFHRKLRPPKGIINLNTLRYSATTRRPLYLWNVDPKDYAADSIEQLQKCFDQKPIKGGDIVLLHDKTPYIAPALDSLLVQLKRDGLKASL